MKKFKKMKKMKLMKKIKKKTNSSCQEKLSVRKVNVKANSLIMFIH